MKIRSALLQTSDLTAVPHVKPLFDPRDPMAWPFCGKSWAEMTPHEIYEQIAARVMVGNGSPKAGGLL